EAIGNALADFVNRPPGNIADFNRVGRQDRIGLGDDVVDGNAVAEFLVVLGYRTQVRVHPHQMAAFTWNQDHRAGFGADDGLFADVGEVGVDQDIQHAPGMVLDVAVQLSADGFADRRAGAVATDHVFGANRAGRTRVGVVRGGQGDFYWIVLGFIDDLGNI